MNKSSTNSRRSSTTKPQRRRQQLRRVAGAVVILFALLWGLVLWQAHSKLISPIHRSFGGLGPQLLPLASRPSSNNNNNKNIEVEIEIEIEIDQDHHHPKQQQQQPQQQHEEGSSTIDNPYFGWQPPIPTESSCSWRVCFNKDHDCPTCRDLPQDLDHVPAVPASSTSSSHGSDGVNTGTTSGDWIPDVTMLYRMRLHGQDAQGNPWPPPLPDELCEDIGDFGGRTDGNKVLLEKVPITAPPLTLEEEKSTPKVLCMLYTMKEQHATNIRAIRETWASYCDGFLAFSTADDPRIPAISLPHEGKEEYNNMWQKVRSIWKFVGTHYIDDFDFFFQGGEDLFVIPQNLKRYLRDLLLKEEPHGKTPDDDFFVGRRFKGYGPNNYFNSGGAGYALSRGTLRRYIQGGGWENSKLCAATRHTAMEDVMIAQCLRDMFHIGLTDTRDSQLRERFHPFAPASHYQWRPPVPEAGEKDWYADYNEEWPPLLKEQCCAPDSVSFHYIKKPAMVRHLFALLNTCGGGHDHDHHQKNNKKMTT